MGTGQKSLVVVLEVNFIIAASGVGNVRLDVCVIAGPVVSVFLNVIVGFILAVIVGFILAVIVEFILAVIVRFLVL
jgi:hypothetical protein